MTSAKSIHVAPISSQDARAFVRRHHYSGKTTTNSQLHLGAFLGTRIVGVAQFGPPMDRSKAIGLVRGTPWNGLLELNRLALLDDTPRNTESRFLAVSMRLLRKHAPHVQWVLSFADATQCGDGTIYRAAGFVLTGIKRNKQMLRMPDGSIMARKTLDDPNHRGIDGRFGSAVARDAGAVALPGFQLRYIYFIDPTARDRLTVPVLPFSAIAEAGAGMYLGKPRASEASSDAPSVQDGEGGAAPTLTLQVMTKPRLSRDDISQAATVAATDAQSVHEGAARRLCAGLDAIPAPAAA